MSKNDWPYRIPTADDLDVVLEYEGRERNRGRTNGEVGAYVSAADIRRRRYFDLASGRPLGPHVFVRRR
jgi:hypothetical protein